MLHCFAFVAATCAVAVSADPSGYTKIADAFCSRDKALPSTAWKNASDPIECSTLCNSLNGCVMFEWGCHRTQSCLLFKSVAACGAARKSSCGSKVT